MILTRTTRFAALLILLIAAALLTSSAQPTLLDVDEINVARAKPGGAANCSDDDPASYLNTSTPTGWVAPGGTAHLNVSTIPSGLDATTVVSRLQSSFNTWTGAPTITVATDGSVTRYTANGKNDLLWGRSGSSIATTYTWRWSDGLVESDVVFNMKYAWYDAGSEEGDGCQQTAGSRYDVGNIATHEFGHVYGLGHPAGARFESMYAFGYTGETLKRSPTPGELDGITALY